MRGWIRALGVAGIVAPLVAAGGSPLDRTAATALLDRYLRGDDQAVVDALSAESSLDDFLQQLKRDGPAWIDADGPAERNRRELTAATVALEAARAGEWRAWKLRITAELPSDAEGPRRPPVVTLYWKAPPLLLEWGCALIRVDHQPVDVRRDWFRASIAVAERAEDYEFLVGDTKLDELADKHIYEYNSDVILHARHAALAFPNEPRFKLAQAIAEELHDPPAAQKRYEEDLDDVDLRGEAAMRLGVMAYWQKADERALAQFAKTESLTRDPWVLYLGRYVTGLVEIRRHHPADAERAFRRALEAVPRAQAATVSLATLLFESGRRAEAGALEEAMTAGPAVADPWRGYADADDRFWPILIARLRKAIAS